MFGISTSELVLILLVALIILGPKQLANLLSRAWLILTVFKSQIEKLKQETLKNSTFEDIQKIEQNLSEKYFNLKDKIMTKNSVIDNDDYHSNNLYEQDILYQPELDFEREPELFDELNIR
jgi:Sec-independent protein translocase protein TatA